MLTDHTRHHALHACKPANQLPHLFVRRYGLVQPALRRCTVLPSADTVLAADDEVVMTRPVTLSAAECQPLPVPVPIDLGAPLCRPRFRAA